MAQAIHDSRGMVHVAARQLGVARKTVYDYLKKHKRLRDLLEEERAYTTDTAELALYHAIANGEAWAVCFYLKTQGKDRGYVERTEIAGVEDKPIKVTLKLGRPDGNGVD
jgi:hypothetical protein